MNEFYRSLQYLVLGTRLRRLSEAMLVDINSIYADHHADFDAFWFPIFYILSRNEQVTNKFIAEELLITHSAVSQLLSNMQDKGYIQTAPSPDDARKKIVLFTPAGKKLQKDIEPLWDALQVATEQWVKEHKESEHILSAIGKMEESLKKKSLQSRVDEVVKKQKRK